MSNLAHKASSIQNKYSGSRGACYNPVWLYHIYTNKRIWNSKQNLEFGFDVESLTEFELNESCKECAKLDQIIAN